MVLVVLGMILAGVFSWTSIERNTYAQLALNSSLLAIAAGVRFTEYRAELDIVAGDILDERVLSNPLRAQTLLKNSLRGIPQATTIDLFAPNGHLVAAVGDTSTVPPPLAGDSFMTVAPEKTPHRGEFAIGRLVHSSAPDRWAIPLRLTMRDAHGRPLFSLMMFLDPARILIDWRAALSHSQLANDGLAFGMLRSDGYLLASWPLPKGNRAGAYDGSVPGSLAPVAQRFSKRRQGHYVGVAEPYAGLRMISFAHVGGANVGRYPAVAEASILRDAAIARWWREFIPILLLGMLLLLVLYLGIELLCEAERRVDMLQSRREEELLREARVDSLTGLPNRFAFLERVDEALARADRGGSHCAVGIIDLDDFKMVNDRFGHPVGDAVLIAVAERLRAGLRTCDYVARLGGDEFALLLDYVNSERDLEKPLHRLERHLAAPIILESGESFDAQGSLGVTIYPLDPSDRDGLLRHADYAMYQAKAEKSDRNSFWRSYDGTFRKVRVEAQKKWSALLAEGALRLHYQPILDARSGNVIVVEALARLAEGAELHPPAAFLPNLGPNDLRLLSESVLTNVLRDMKAWDEAGHHIDVAVNVDPVLLMMEEFVPFLKDLIERTHTDPQRVTVEILEVHTFDSLELARRRLADLKELGVRLSLDDIGSAYSSLLRLKRLPIDEIKLDRAFISDLFLEPSNLAYVMALQSLAANLNLTLVAEGVENYDIVDAMLVLGVDRIQGFGISQPIPAPELLSWLQSGHRFWVDQRPQTLLGAYAAHRIGHERIRRSWREISKHTRADFQNCRMGSFLATAGRSYAQLIESHRAYHDAAAVASRPDDPAIQRARSRIDAAVQRLLLLQPPAPVVREAVTTSIIA